MVYECNRPVPATSDGADGVKIVNATLYKIPTSFTGVAQSVGGLISGITYY